MGPPPHNAGEAFLSVCDCYGSLDRLSSLRIAAAALAVHHRQAAADTNPLLAAADTNPLRAPPPLPPHAREASRRGAGALYAAMRGVRQARLQQAMRAWYVSCMMIHPEPSTTQEEAPPLPPPLPPAPDKSIEMAAKLKAAKDENSILQATLVALEASQVQRTAQLMRQVEALQRALVQSEQRLALANEVIRRNPNGAEESEAEDEESFRKVREQLQLHDAVGSHDAELELEKREESPPAQASPGSWFQALSPFTLTNLRRRVEGAGS